jgi:hypothetical protein
LVSFERKLFSGCGSVEFRKVSLLRTFWGFTGGNYIFSYIFSHIRAHMGKQVKLRRVGGSLVLTLPRAIAEYLGFAEGDYLELEPIGPSEIRVRKVQQHE